MRINTPNKAFRLIYEDDKNEHSHPTYRPISVKIYKVGLKKKEGFLSDINSQFL